MVASEGLLGRGVSLEVGFEVVRGHLLLTKGTPDFLGLGGLRVVGELAVVLLRVLGRENFPAALEFAPLRRKKKL